MKVCKNHERKSSVQTFLHSCLFASHPSGFDLIGPALLILMPFGFFFFFFLEDPSPGKFLLCSVSCKALLSRKCYQSNYLESQSTWILQVYSLLEELKKLTCPVTMLARRWEPLSADSSPLLTLRPQAAYIPFVPKSAGTEGLGHVHLTVPLPSFSVLHLLAPPRAMHCIMNRSRAAWPLAFRAVRIHVTFTLSH